MIIAAFIPNIFDRSRFGGEHRNDVIFVADAAELINIGPDLVIVDLDRCPDPAAFLAPTTDGDARAYRSIGFGPHVEAKAHEQARLLGFDEVLPRSKFFRQLTDLLADPSPDPLPNEMPSDES